MLLRRELLGKAAVGAAAAAVTLGAARPGTAAMRTGTPGARDATGTPDGAPTSGPAATPGTPATVAAPSTPPPWALVSPLTAGAALAAGWRLVDLGPVRDGVCVATLGNARGRTHRVHLCRNAGSPQGLVYTRGVDLVVMNEGNRELPTEEPLAQAVAALAHTVAANETQVPDVLAGLVAHTERVARYATAQGPEADGKLR
jgi:hypothetical protein